MDTEKKETQDFQPLTPREIVGQLDKYVIGQKNAKRSVAIALGTAGAASGSPKICATRSPPKTSS